MKISVEEAQEHLEFLIEKSLNGEKIFIYTENQDLVKLEPFDEKVKNGSDAILEKLS